MATVASVNWSGGGLGNDDIREAANVAATKVVHQFPIRTQLFDGSTAISAKTEMLYCVYGATATIVAFQGWVYTAGATSGTVTVDLQKWTEGSPGSWGTICTTPITIPYDATTDSGPYSAVLSSTSLVAEDELKAVVAVSGGGTYPSGLCVALFLREAAT